MSSLSQVPGAALGAQELWRISRNHLPAMSRACPASVTWAGFWVWGLGFAACTAHSWWEFACLDSEQNDGGSLFSHGLGSGLKWSLVLMGGRSGILALLAHGFPGKKNSKNPQHGEDSSVSQCSENCGELVPVSLSQPSVPVGIFEPPWSWEMGSGSSGAGGHNSCCLWGSGGSWPIPGALGSLGNADSSGMGGESLMDPSTASRPALPQPSTSLLICSEPLWGGGATICHPLGGFGILGQELCDFGIFVEEFWVSLCFTRDFQVLQCCCSLNFWLQDLGGAVGLGGCR